MSIVAELQELALDSSCDVANLLRKAFVVAYKLNLRAFKSWVECELNGYEDKNKPPYRIVEGQPIAFEDGRWKPLLFPNAEVQASYSRVTVGMAVGVLQDWLAKDKVEGKHQLILYYAPDEEAKLMRRMESEPSRPALRVSTSSPLRILEAVRNTVLTWTLKLQEDGIIGEGLTFTSEEKQIATAKQDELRPVVQVINNMTIGTVSNSVIQQGSPQAEVYFDPDENPC